ncbi:glycosyl hydrolase 2 galactose-binding domain-containing protein [Nibricoccus sp. IMCC34717]|uniref:glycoside hydrolase family 2 protein n=1 Tax=Nibricoccus sp. IMCC34717 TaxID=3034021 RepID=UPI00384EC0B3
MIPTPRLIPSCKAASLCLLWLLLLANVFAAVPELLSPRADATVNKLTPTFAWSPVEGAERYEVFVDGIKISDTPAWRCDEVVFPLSFGSHEWQVVAVRGVERLASESRRLTIDDAPLALLPPRSQLLRQHWRVQSAWLVAADGAALSAPGFDTTGWFGTSVPATALTALVRNGVYPDPYVGLNNTRIPDANDAFNAENNLLRFSHIAGRNPWAKPYWFRTEFTVAPGLHGRRAWLVLNEINYRADVWLNGHQVGKGAEVVGMERSFRFDVTALLRADGPNALAVAIHPLDHPGLPEKAPVTPLADPGRNMGADATISFNYSKWDTIGWDWQPEVHDRDMGITEDVYLHFTDDIELREPYVTSDLPLPDTHTADLRVSFDAVNHGAYPVSGTIRATICDAGQTIATVEQPITLGAGETRRVDWSPAGQPSLHLRNPRLWWPAELGAPVLHTLSLEWTTADGQRAALDEEFGIRKFTTRISPVTHSRIFSVNGRDLYTQGGNWVIEMLLNGTASRYEEEIELARRANLNVLRVWGPTGAPPDAFFRAADRRGVLIWQDFLHDHWGTDQNAPGFAPPEPLFEAASTALIKRLRNHASLFLWCGGNEGPNPREDLLVKKLLPAFDPHGTRHYLTASLADGLQGGGPYHTLAPRDYFGRSKLTGLNSEIGPSGVPVWESVRQFLTLPPTVWAPGQFPLDGEWAYHDANDRPGGDERKFTTFDQLLRTRFGVPEGTGIESVRDYVGRAQLVGFEAYRAAVEALNKHRWEKSTGFALWKFNASWPSLTWQIADWYLQTNAGYYAVRKAAGPVHVQFNADDRTLTVVNRTASDEAGLRLFSEATDLDGATLWQQANDVVLAPDSPQVVGAPVPPLKGVALLSLRLIDRAGRVRADNSYWLNADENYTALAALSDARVSAIYYVKSAGKAQVATVTVTNTGRQPAVLLRLRLIDPATGIEQLPVYWSDNYKTLVRGESAVLTAELPATGDAGASGLVLEVSGLNVKPFRVAP